MAEPTRCDASVTLSFRRHYGAWHGKPRKLRRFAAKSCCFVTRGSAFRCRAWHRTAAHARYDRTFTVRGRLNMYTSPACGSSSQLAVMPTRYAQAPFGGWSTNDVPRLVPMTSE
jgi:hypothetical protein